ncbi:hypothetical protein LWC34_29665 [Kibdelosporangium philippinense]|uniref:Uncharacterized protein n=1 Tax=Kibdelosporangium philippinense TaxID=211113 RepID=A0ABS8ZGR1_9PSEU|nr:hypothetical protein [Kibdelosporangium philippinense]MCE7006965.1 hypothetical protein [Kibdelosporangium philippinense]
MPEHHAVVEQWLAMPHPDLTDHIRRLVRGGSTPSPVWTAVGTHPVLAARVRGILSALHAQMADHRDHAMWTLWITNARRALTTPPPAPARPESRHARTPHHPPGSPRARQPLTATPRHRPTTITPVTFLAPGQTTAPDQHNG